ncbi:hypothetical protein D5086_016980 [Populus alba]|uniref:Uncharacterized protein n=1 Tax=Populus alba TaxID=43335 RepID=A0ACC4BY81_POPAL
MFSAVIHWGEGKVLILRKFKDKLQVTKTRSLRFEDNNNRRVFLRSYPLPFGAEDEKTNDEKVSATNKDTEKKPIRRMFLAVIHWGEGKVLILRKFKHKLQVKSLSPIPSYCSRQGIMSTKQKKEPEVIFWAIPNTDAFLLLIPAENPLESGDQSGHERECTIYKHVCQKMP